MNRQAALSVVLLFASCHTCLWGAERPSPLPQGPEPEPVAVPHFPSRLHAFLWRNWGLVPEERLARLLQAPLEDLRAVAASLGLPHEPAVDPAMERRGYLTLIRRNWHLLPYGQILDLLEWTEGELAYTLREDDFFWIKLGRLKPKCAPLRFRKPTAAEAEHAGRIRDYVVAQFGESWHEETDPRFGFVDRLSRGLSPPGEDTAESASADSLSPRFLYSYFALYGDPLLEPDLDPFPAGYLERLAAVGVDGIWLQGILRRLAPSRLFPEEGKLADRRLENLRQLVERAAKYGVGVFLYFNEPRAQPLAWFESHPALRGVQERDVAALCTSTDEVRSFLREGTSYIFRKVPELRGIFTITASENLTNCWSHRAGGGCPRCRDRTAAEVIAEVNVCLAEGARAGSPRAEFIAWDWGWDTAWVEPIVKALPDGVRLQSVSEWSLPIERGGIQAEVGEYSISAVGPGPRATRHWAIAKERGLPLGAKVQINNTWEISTVPYVPALELVAEHLHRLRSTGVTSLMLSWTLGGYPSVNLELASEFYGPSPPSPQEALERVAKRRYGAQSAAALRAWKIFSGAFAEYPFHIRVLYAGPQQLGPANLLYPERTGYHASMVGFPYDDLDAWRAVYPPEVFAAQFEKMAERWQEGLEALESAIPKLDDALRPEALRDLDVARACRLHFASIACQARYVIARNTLLDTEDPELHERESRRIRGLVSREENLAAGLFEIARRDSRIGFEASNHYYYLPRDLLEKAICCRYLLDKVFTPREEGGNK